MRLLPSLDLQLDQEKTGWIQKGTGDERNGKGWIVGEQSSVISHWRRRMRFWSRSQRGFFFLPVQSSPGQVYVNVDCAMDDDV